MNPTLLIGAIQGAMGLTGMLSNLNRPKYEIPSAQNQALGLANMRANSNDPNYTSNQQNAQLATANQISAAKEAGNPLSVLPQLQANENAAMRNIEAQNARYRDQAVQQQQQALQTQANYQDQAFQVNEFQPFVDKQNMFQDMLGAGIKNTVGAFDQANSLKILQNGFAQMQQNQSVSNFLNGGGQNKWNNGNIMDMPTRSYNGINTGFSSPILTT